MTLSAKNVHTICIAEDDPEVRSYLETHHRLAGIRQEAAFQSFQPLREILDMILISVWRYASTRASFQFWLYHGLFHGAQSRVEVPRRRLPRHRRDHPVTVTVGSRAATVYGAALSPGYAGLYQVAIQIPKPLANGDYPRQRCQAAIPKRITWRLSRF